MHGTMRRRRWVVLAAPLVLVALLLVAWGFMRLSPSHAAPVFSERHIPLSGTITNPCGGEDVAIVSGDMQIVIHATTDGAGGLHYDVQINTQGETGVGLTSGARYEMSGGHKAISYDAVGPGSVTATNTIDSRIIGQGPDNNAFFTFQFHLTITPDGTTTASIDNSAFVCH